MYLGGWVACALALVSACLIVQLGSWKWGDLQHTEGAAVNPFPPSELLSSRAEIGRGRVDGVGWAELERRARPGGVTGLGMIALDESLEEVVLQQWEVVEGAHLSHTLLASALTSIVRQALLCMKENNTDECSVSWHPHERHCNALRPLCDGYDCSGGASSRNIHVEVLRTRGMQQDLIEPHNFARQWNTEYVLTWSSANRSESASEGGIAPKHSLRVGGYVHLDRGDLLEHGDAFSHHVYGGAPHAQDAGALRYVAKLGFYQGNAGAGNPYLMPPLAALDLACTALPSPDVCISR